MGRRLSLGATQTVERLHRDTYNSQCDTQRPNAQGVGSFRQCRINFFG